MLRILAGETQLCDRIPRREVLRLGGLGALSLFGGRFLNLPAAAEGPNRFGQARSVSFLSLYGGPSHLDMFDLKPEAASEVRGEFEPIETSVSGIRICEYLPRLAKLAHRYALVRSVTHEDNGHGSALYTSLT